MVKRGIGLLGQLSIICRSWRFIVFFSSNLMLCGPGICIAIFFVGMYFFLDSVYVTIGGFGWVCGFLYN